MAMNTSTQRVLLTGATGVVGSQLVPAPPDVPYLTSFTGSLPGQHHPRCLTLHRQSGSCSQ